MIIITQRTTGRIDEPSAWRLHNSMLQKHNFLGGTPRWNSMKFYNVTTSGEIPLIMVNTTNLLEFFTRRL
jgi:hypothetical protein